MCAGEKPFDTRLRARSEGLRGRFVQCRAPVQVIDHDKNGAGFRGASPA